MKQEYEIKNWDKFQQYKDGRPMQWIKIQVSLLDNCSFDELNELDQLNLLKLWLFAAKSGGKFEGSEKFLARKIGATKLNINNLLDSGFVVRTESYETVPRVEKSREEEKREDKSRREDKKPLSGKPNDDALEILDHLNKIRSSGFKPVASNIKLITARIAEGHSKQEMLDVVSMKNDEWSGSTKMEKFLRPATLFNAEKFNQYVGELDNYRREKAGELDWLPDNAKQYPSNVIEGVFSHG